MRISDWSSDVCSSELRHGFDRGRPTAVAREDEAQPDIATRRGGDVEVEPCRIVVARGPLCWFAVLQGHTEEVLQDIEILGLRQGVRVVAGQGLEPDRKSTRLNSSH